jgi:hypothetical protein
MTDPTSRTTRNLAARFQLGAVLAMFAGFAGFAAGCGTVGKGPDPDPVPDLSHPADMAAPQCSPKNCNGCCAGDVCQPGVMAAACGTAGAACVQCSDAQMCSAATFSCAFDPNANWLVSVISAQITTTNPLNMNKDWRTDKTMPQPFIQYDPNDVLPQVAIVVSGNTWTASWGGLGFVYAAKDLLSTGVDLQMFDQEGMMTPTPMTNKHHLTFSQQDLMAHTLNYSGWEGASSISINLQRHQ